MAERTLTVKIVGDEKDLLRAFQRSSQATQRFSVSASSILKSAFVVGGAVAGIRLLTGAIDRGITEFSEMQKVTAQTQAVLRSTGGIANVTGADIDKLASSISRMTGIDDEAIAAGENLLLTFKNVRNEVGQGNAIFDRATQAAVDLSVAGFGSLDSTAKQLGKALNDPVRGMTALGRAGVTFTESQRNTIKALVESNDLLGAQRIILREVESQVGGSARAFGETLPGQLAKLKNALDEVFGRLVGVVAGQLTRLIPEIERLTDAISGWLDQQENVARIQDATRQALDIFLTTLRTVRDVFNAVVPVIESAVRALGGLRNALELLIAAFVATKVLAFTGALTGLSTQALVATGRVSALRGALLRLGALGVIVLSIEFLTNYDEIQGQFTDLLRKAHLLSDAPVGPTPEHLAALEKRLRAVGQVYGFNSEEAAKLGREVDALKIKMAALSGQTFTFKIEAELPGDRAEGPTGPGFGQFTPGRAAASLAAGAAAGGDAIIARITRQTAAQRDLNRQLADSEKRAAHLADLIRADPANVTLQKRYADELRKQAQLREDIATTAQSEARALRDAASAAKDAAAAAAAERKERERLALLAAQTARKGRQFEAIGLTAEGQTRTPGVDALTRRLGTLREQIEGTPLDTAKTRSRLAQIGRVLAGKFGEVGKEVRSAILQMFADITGALDEGDQQVSGEFTRGGIRSTQKLLKGLGLTAEQAEELKRRNLGVAPRGPSAFGFGLGPTTSTTGFDRPGRESGGFGIVNEVRVFIGGQEVQNVITREQQKKGRRTAGSRRGRAGGRMGGV